MTVMEPLEPDPDDAGEVRPAEPPENYAHVRQVIADWMDATPASERQGGRPDAAARLAVQAQLVALRLQGFTYAELARRYGYASGSGVRQVVLRALQGSTTAGERREAVALENARYDRAAAALWPKVLQGDARAHDSWVRNRQAAANLNGWNAPKQVQISAGVQAGLDDALTELDEALGEVVTGPWPWSEPPALEAGDSTDDGDALEA